MAAAYRRYNRLVPPEGSDDPGAPPAPTSSVTELLAAAREGDRTAFDRIFSLVYDELRRVASRQAMRFGAGPSLATTALVHEAYLKLGGDDALHANDRVHFFAIAARAMRQILIDHARHGGRRKRGGGAAVLSLDQLGEAGHVPATPAESDELLALDRALERLGALDPELERLVEWRFFAGLTIEEIGDLTGTAERTLKRRWAVARGFLLREMGEGPPTPAAS
jgi:RNA polymerase sigma factor (TIGR02999 family)